MPVCAIYARVSDEEQARGESVAHQISFMREFARRRADEGSERWLTPDQYVFRDEGISGTSIIKRVAVQELIRNAKARNFDVVLFKGISRFARDTVDALVMLRTLQACGLRVISFEENFDSARDNAELIFTMHSAVAQYESEKIGIRVRLGNYEKAKQGKWCGITPDGYRLNRETKRLEVDPSRASVIRRIFELYEQGNGTLRIADTLNKEGYRTRAGVLWNFTTLRRMLRNPAYVGDVVYGARERTPAPPSDDNPLERRYRTVMTKDMDRVAIYRDAHEPIVGRSQWERVQDMIDGKKTPPGRKRHDYLLIGMLKCKCGASMTTKYNGRGTRYYRCARKFSRGQSVCDQAYIRADEIEPFVLDRVRSDVMNHLNEEKLRQMSSDHSRPKDDPSTRLQSVAHDIDREMQKSVTLFDRYMDGVLSDDQFSNMNQTIRSRIESLQRTKADLERRVLTQQAEPAQDVVERLQSFLSISEITRSVLRSLVEEIRIEESDGEEVGVSIRYSWG